MAEKPILFSTEMVRAILEGRKTQTRRVIKPQPEGQPMYCYAGSDRRDHNKWLHGGKRYTPPCHGDDVLWVRETWGNYSYDEPESNATYYLYRADYPSDAKGYWYEPEHINFCDFPKWRPSIHMPREAARLFLMVKRVRVERVQDITEEDARAEGVGLDFGASDPRVCKWQNHRDAFRALWNSIYAKPKKVYAKDEDGNIFISHYESFPFDGESRTEIYKGKPHYMCANPWVWVVEFERVDLIG